MEFDAANYFKFAMALAFVLGLFGIMVVVAKRFGLGNRGPVRRGRNRRLEIVETMSLDAKRRIVLIRRDATEHLVLVGANSEQIVETGIAADGDEISGRLREVGGRSLAAVSRLKTTS